MIVMQIGRIHCLLHMGRIGLQREARIKRRGREESVGRRKNRENGQDGSSLAPQVVRVQTFKGGLHSGTAGFVLIVGKALAGFVCRRLGSGVNIHLKFEILLLQC